jgi:DNA-binding MarR family transcriptional regulator
LFRDCNCHSLRQATRRVTQLYDRALAPLELRATQYSLLVEVRHLGPVSLILLADALVMDRATLGHNIRPLEAREYLSLTIGTDRRVRKVSLTKGGQEIVAEAQPLWRKAQRVFEREMGARDAEVMRGLLHRVAGSELVYT